MSAHRLKVLCLHGFTSNGAVHAHQIRNITKALPEYEFIFPDGPHKVNISPEENDAKPEGRMWTEFVTSMSPSGHRAWWFAKEGKEDGTGDYVGLNDSLDFIGNVMQQDGPFHAIWGFSQGACFASILCALLQRRATTYPLRTRLPEGAQSPMLGIIFSGFKARFPQYDEIYGEGYNIPMMHVIGVKDYNVSNERSQALAALSKDAIILQHDGGHQIPGKPEEISQIVDFLRKHVSTNTTQLAQ